MKYVFTCGGTMGHIKPAMVVIDELIKDNEIIFFGNDNSKEKAEASKRDKLDFVTINVIGFNRKNIIKILKTIYLFIKAYHYSLKKLKALNPDVVFGFGGYVSAPVLLAALKLKIKTCIHEQNSIPGLVNSYFGKRVNKAFLSFQYTKKYFKDGIVVGNPVSSRIKYTKSDIKYNDGKKILFIGGSLGAKKINEMADLLKDDYQITLICGDKYYSKINDKGINVLKYYDDLPSLMIESDLVVSRSGASTIAEIIAIGKPVIFIPSPNVANNHQEINANMLYDINACEMILEADCTKEVLQKKIDKIINNQFIAEEMIMRQREHHVYNSLGVIINELKNIN